MRAREMTQRQLRANQQHVDSTAIIIFKASSNICAPSVASATRNARTRTLGRPDLGSEQLPPNPRSPATIVHYMIIGSIAHFAQQGGP